MKKNQFIQEICEDCLHLLVNGESDMMEEKNKSIFVQTMVKWHLQNYKPITYQSLNHFFSHYNCDICECLPGTRYNFIFERR